jgi:hypothetical protein
MRTTTDSSHLVGNQWEVIHMHSFRYLLAVAALAPAALTACGDDTAAPSSAEFVERGSAVCAEFGPKVAEAFPNPTGEPDVAFVRSFAGDLADVLAAGHDRFEEITPPDDQSEAFEAFLEGIDQSVAVLRQSLTDDAVAVEIVRQGPPLEEGAIAAAALGFEGCG